MATIAFRLNNVPEAEADQVRELLTENEVPFYETHAGRWGISVAALWVSDNNDFERARMLIEEFQLKHSTEMRQQFEEDVKNGVVPTFWQLLRANPGMFITYWLLILAVAAFSIVPIYKIFF